MISKAPMGMIANIQAVRFNRKKFELSCLKIVKHVAKKDSLSGQVLDALIKEFGESGSYDYACERANKILNEFDFTPRQVKTIRRYIKKYYQIHQTKEAREFIFKFMDRYSSYFDDDFRDWYDSKKASRMWMSY